MSPDRIHRAMKHSLHRAKRVQNTECAACPPHAKKLCVEGSKFCAHHDAMILHGMIIQRRPDIEDDRIIYGA